MIIENGSKLDINSKGLKKICSNRLLTTSEAAKIIGISPKQLIRYCLDGKIHYYLVGKQFRLNIEDVLNFKK